MVNYECKKCYKKFNKKGDYDRHNNRKIPCVNNENSDTNNVAEKLDIIIQSHQQLKKSNENLTKLVHNLQQEVKELKNNKKCIEFKGDINIQNIQINLIEHGKEDLSYLTFDQIQTILAKGLKGPEKYVELVHFNNDKAEYKNICITNKKNMNEVLVFDGTDWKLCDYTTIENLRDKGIEFMEEKYDEVKDNLPIRIKKIMDRFNNNISANDSEKIKNKMTKEIKYMLYNNRAKINK